MPDWLDIAGKVVIVTGGSSGIEKSLQIISFEIAPRLWW